MLIPSLASRQRGHLGRCDQGARTQIIHDIVAAEKAGELKIKQLALVINMPFVIWDGGKR